MMKFEAGWRWKPSAFDQVVKLLPKLSDESAPSQLTGWLQFFRLRP
jgi:hypothetical protein